MNIYIDFDRTLFNTDLFLKDFKKIFNNYGISNVFFDECVSKMNNGFDYRLIITEFKKNNDLNNNIYSDIDFLFKNICNYLYDDTVQLLKYLKEKQYKLFLLTRGNLDIQKMKIANSKIENYFEEIIITLKHKGDLNIDYSNSIFIDDNYNELESILLNNPLKVIYLVRKDAKYINNVNGILVTSLKEIIDKNII